jgi:hypothetical protein
MQRPGGPNFPDLTDPESNAHLPTLEAVSIPSDCPFEIDADGNFQSSHHSVSEHDGLLVRGISQDGTDIDVKRDWKSEPGKNYVVRLTKNIQFSDREYHVSFWSGFDFHVHNM